MWRSIINFFRKLFTSGSQADPETGETFMEQLADEALPFVEALLGTDLDGDTKVMARDEILEAAATYGLKKLRKLVDAMIPGEEDSDELKRLLAAARSLPRLLAILDRFGIELKWRWVEGAVWAAYVFATEDEE
jgi:hypothetical protein